MKPEAIATNRAALRDYFLLDKIEAGIELRGTEVKSLRAHRVNLKDSFGRIEKGEVFVYNMHISPYEFGNRLNHDPLRPRKLLLKKVQIKRLIGKVAQKGLTLVPLRIYFNSRGRAKMELVVGQGKRRYEKRQTLRKKETLREVERTVRHHAKIKM